MSTQKFDAMIGKYYYENERESCVDIVEASRNKNVRVLLCLGTTNLTIYGNSLGKQFKLPIILEDIEFIALNISSIYIRFKKERHWSGQYYIDHAYINDFFNALESHWKTARYMGTYTPKTLEERLASVEAFMLKASKDMYYILNRDGQPE